MHTKRHSVVFDTSTLVSAAILPHSQPAKALERAFHDCTLFASDATLAELREVLARDRFDRYRSPALRQAFYQLISDAVERIEVHEDVQDCRDPKDNKFLALAKAAEAEVIISSDADLLTLHPYHGIEILTPAVFLNWGESVV
ncbi:putative toxin-antitoxin system toxin component, PIN family [Burkholderiaceae bacterium DAT-1]|nr:putative toxin-antitoxin system toxin component, PIN family [Burkholderiaceae bacterium DAT-1]